jgi:hypothetical protein
MFNPAAGTQTEDNIAGLLGQLGVIQGLRVGRSGRTER